MPIPYIYIFFYRFQDYFSSYETGQSVGGAKTGETQEKSPGTPANSAALEPTPDTVGDDSD